MARLVFCVSFLFGCLVFASAFSLGLGFVRVMGDSATAGVPVRIMGNFQKGGSVFGWGSWFGGDCFIPACWPSTLVHLLFGTTSWVVIVAKAVLRLCLWPWDVFLRQTWMWRKGGVFCCSHTIFYTGLGTGNTERLFLLILPRLVSSHRACHPKLAYPRRACGYLGLRPSFVYI